MLAMPRSLRKSTALVAAYSIALQVLFWGLGIGSHGAFGPHGVVDPRVIICGGNNTGDVPQQQDNDCGGCLLACGGGPVLAVLPGAKPALPLFADQAGASPLPVAAAMAPAKHRPQTSRAPPVGG
jgi:hypothetical protein